jgi:hypothetical protein
MIRIQIEGNASRAEVVEAIVWTIFCVSGVGVGLAMIEWPSRFTHIAVLYGTAYLALAAWVVRRKRARGDARIWL